MTSACPFVFRQTPTDRLPHCFGAKLMRPSSRWVFSQPMVRWLGREDSNFHITIPKNAFEMSTEFPLIWPEIRPRDFCSCELCNEQTRQRFDVTRPLADQLPFCRIPDTSHRV